MFFFPLNCIWLPFFVSLWSFLCVWQSETSLKVWLLQRCQRIKAFWEPWTGTVWWTNWVFAIQGGCYQEQCELTLVCLLYPVDVTWLWSSFFSPQFKFNKGFKCKLVCSTKTYKQGNKDDIAKLDFIKMGMQLNYQHHWLVVVPHCSTTLSFLCMLCVLQYLFVQWMKMLINCMHQGWS